MHNIHFRSNNPTFASVCPLALDSAIFTNEAIIEHTKLEVIIKITIWITHEPGQDGGRGKVGVK